MSYILKALKKSEAERTKGTVPRLTPQMASTPKTRSAVWPWVIGTALVVNATVVGFAAWGPEIQLLKGVGRQDGEAQIAASPAPVGDAAALTAAVPKAQANGREPQGPAPAQAAAQPQAPQARSAAQPQIPPRQAAAQPGTTQAGPAQRAQTSQQRPVQQRKAMQPRPPAQPRDSEQVAAARPQPPESPQPARPQAPKQQAAAPPQDQRQRRGTQPRTPAPRRAVEQQARPATPGEQGTQTRNAAAGVEAANGEGTVTSRTVDSPPQSTGQGVPTESAASDVTTPKPARKPREALSRSAQRPVLGDPLPLGGDLRTAKVGPDLALAAPKPEPVETQAPPEPEPDPYAAVPMHWQLPSAIRSTLPKLSISVHVYSPKAEGRFVIVERTKYREGDVMAGGARLEAIVADGIVLDYEGRRYRIGN